MGSTAKLGIVTIGAAVLAGTGLAAGLGVGSAEASRPPQGVGPVEGVSDRAYVANEGTGTISVIDTTTDRVVDTICLGSDPALSGTPRPAGPCNAESDHHAALYNGHVGTHGLYLTPQSDVLLATNRISGTVVAVDTTTNELLGYLPVGREPHLVTVRPGGEEAWAAIRGEDYVEVMDLDRDDLHDDTRHRTERFESRAKLATPLGPSMVAFDSGGRHAFVVAAKEARVVKFDAETREVVAERAVPARFTPFGFVTPDDEELWLVHKGAGTISILTTDDLSPVIEGMPVGARANHVAFIGPYAYVSVAGAPGQDGKVVIVDRSSKTVVHELTGPAWSGEPHGIWPAGDSKVYVGHEGGDRVTVLDVGASGDATDDVVTGTITDRYLDKPIDVVVAP